MMNFESDLSTNVRVIPAGMNDSADEWMLENDVPSEEDMAWFFEAMFDPDGPHEELFV